MGYTTLHSIKSTLKKAIDYICDPNKTNSQTYISAEHCGINTAHRMFEMTRKRHGSNVNNLAFHIVQSFKKGEVTPEQALEIGKETMKRFLGNDYEFIIATHTDTGKIHNHIIVNSVNMINGKSFSTEHDRKGDPAWLRIRKISDELLIQNGLSVIEAPENTGKSHYEWSMNNQGLSWKTQLKRCIDNTIKIADNFDSFIEQMRSQDITVRYEPYKTKDGMIIAFKMPEQKHFIYSKTLGKFYSEESISDRIERSVKRRNMTSNERRQQRILNDDGELKRLYDVSDMNDIGLQKWAENENRKIKMQTLNVLHEKGFSSYLELELYREKLMDSIERNSDSYAELKKQLVDMKAIQNHIDIYRDYKEIYDYYTTRAVDPDNYFRSHETEILLFEEAKNELKMYFDTVPNRAVYRNEVAEIESQMKAIKQNTEELRTEHKSLDTLTYNLGIIYKDMPVREPENEPAEHQTEEQKKYRSNDYDIEL